MGKRSMQPGAIDPSRIGPLRGNNNMIDRFRANPGTPVAPGTVANSIGGRAMSGFYGGGGDQGMGVTSWEMGPGFVEPQPQPMPVQQMQARRPMNANPGGGIQWQQKNANRGRIEDILLQQFLAQMADSGRRR